MSRKTCLIAVVAGIICNAQREILIALRPQHVPQGDLWEFPGGKIEPTETPFIALQRELQEEVGIQVIHAKPFMQIHHAYPERNVDLDVWWVEEFVGVPHGVEGQEVRWVRPVDLLLLKFPSANLPIIEKLQHCT